MENKTTVHIEICGRTYTLVSQEREEHIKAVAEEVEKKITEILSINPRLTYEMAATLVALNMCSDLKTERMIKDINNDLSAQNAMEKKIEAQEGMILELKRQLEKEREEFSREREKLRLDWIIKEKEFLDMIEGM